MKVVNPATEELLEIEDSPLESLPAMVDAARSAQSNWSQLTVAERAEILLQLGPVILENSTELAQCITDDMGKPIRKSRDEIQYAVSQYRFFCEQAAAWLDPEPAKSGFIQFDPLGVIGVISPWNVPVITPLLAIGPALLAGNGVIFKPSENALRTGRALGRLFAELSDLPTGIVQTFLGGKQHGQAVVDSDVDMISFTGSDRVGKQIMKASADRVRPILLELGGLDAAIVLKDADLSAAAKQLVRNNCNNTGQICCAVKRVYVEQDVYEQFVEHAIAESQTVSLGAPAEDVDMGPLVASFQLEKVEDTIADAREKGAKIRTGGQRPEGKGYYYPSTVVTDVTTDMKILNDEPFGPLLPIVKVDDWQTGVRLANDTRYGLTGSVWTQDKELGRKICGQLQVGVASLNAHGVGPVGTPFGGAKESGLGRIKNKDGMRAYTNVKMVRVE